MYTLNLNINDEDVRFLEMAQERIIIAKPVNGRTPDVAWLSIRPFQNTTIQWEEEYGLYASRSSVENGATINQLAVSSFPLQHQTFYDFNQSFGRPYPAREQMDVGTFGTHNLDQRFDFLTLGLHQNATVNSNVTEFQPLNAVTALYDRRILFTPYTPVHIWTQANLASRTVITHITSRQTVAEFGAGQTELSFEYRGGRFYPRVDGRTISQPEHLEEMGIRLIENDLL